MIRKIAFSLCVVMSTASMSQAQQTGQAAFDAWLQSYRDLGATASYNLARTSGDRLTVSGLNISFATKLLLPWSSNGDENQSFNLSLSWTSSEVVAENMIAEGNLYSFDTMAFSDGSGLAVRVDPEAGGGAGGITLDARLDGYRSKQRKWVGLPQIADDPKRPFSRWLPLLRTIRHMSVAEERIDRLTVVFEGSDGLEVSEIVLVIEDLVTQDMRNGRVAEYSTGEQKQKTTVLADNAETYVETTTTERATIKGLDFNALLALVDPQARDFDGYRQILDSASIIGTHSKSPFFDAVADSTAYENVAVRAPQTDLLAVLDQLVTPDEQPDAAVPILSIMDLQRSLSLERALMESVSFRFDIQPDTTGSGEIGQIALSNVSADGLEEFSVSSVDIDLGTKGSFSLGKLFIGDIEFPPYEPIETFVSETQYMDEQDQLEFARVFSPRSISIELDGLSLVDILPDDNFNVDRYRMVWRTDVPPLPTSIEVSVDGLEWPVTMIEDKWMVDFLQAAGVEVLRFNENLTMRWDKESEDLFIENVMLELGQFGKLRASAQFGGLSRFVFENPAQYQALIATLNVKSFEAELVNEGGMEMSLAMIAAQAGMSEDMVLELFLEQFGQLLAGLDNQEFAGMAMEAMETFLDDPRNLGLSLAPAGAVPVSQVIASAMTAPQTLPELLGARIEANR